MVLSLPKKIFNFWTTTDGSMLLKLKIQVLKMIFQWKEIKLSPIQPSLSTSETLGVNKYTYKTSGSANEPSDVLVEIQKCTFNFQGTPYQLYRN